MVNTEVLISRVIAISNTANVIKHKVAGSPGILDELLAKIRKLLEDIKDKIINALSSPLAVIRQIAESLYNAINALVDKIVSLAERIVSAIAENIWGFFEAIVAKFKEILSSIISAFNSAISWVVEGIGDIVDSLKERIGKLIDAIKEKWGEFTEALREKLTELSEGVKELANKVKEAIIEAWHSFTEKISEAWHRATEALQRTLREVWEKIREIWEKIYNKIGEIYDRIADYVNGNILAPIHRWAGEAGQRLSYKGNVLLNAALGRYNSFDQFVNDLADPIPIAGGVAAILGGLVLSIAIAPALSTALSPCLENLAHLANEKVRPTLVSPSVAIDNYFRGNISWDTVKAELAKLGYTEDRQVLLREAQRPLPSPGLVQEAYLRGIIDEATHDKMLLAHGYRQFDIDLFKALYKIIPSPPDLIRMAVREAFSPEVAEKFGQYEDFPQAFAEWAEKQGLTREWAERYWAAHWDLPSATMGFEMLHRGIIDENELKLLLRALDVMPFWREKLIKLSYVPYTRVDVRRMYQLGILDYEDVVRAYKDLGYDDEKAKNLAEFTVKYYTPEDKTELDEYRELTRGIYTTAYKRGVISKDDFRVALFNLGYRAEDADLLIRIADAELALKDLADDPLPRKAQATTLLVEGLKRGLFAKGEAKEGLVALGYSEGEADWLIFLSDYEYNAEVRNSFIETIHAKYVNRTYDKSQAQQLLAQVIPTAEEMRKLFELWDIERERRDRKPTEAQFRAALLAGIITLEEYAEELRGLGFDEKYVDMLCKLAVRRA